MLSSYKKTKNYYYYKFDKVQDPDRDFKLDPDKMKADPKHWFSQKQVKSLYF